tara:strand:- start:79 stop:738 length:660 start_codon:yes stop_codon:yes gene_type:complete
MKSYQSKSVGVDELKPNPWNSNVVLPENEQKIEESIKRLGLFKPITVRELEDGSYEILGGQHRWEAACRMGYEKIGIVNVGDVTDKLAKEIGLADNGRYGEDDTGLLKNILNSLDSSAADLAGFLPFALEGLEDVFSGTEVEIDLEDLDMDEDDIELDEDAPTVGPSHQVMRFKVPVDDAEEVSEFIEKIMKKEGFEDEDSLTNAGDALVWLVNQARKG